MRTKSLTLRAIATVDVVTVDRSASLADCACLMRDRHVGTLVVTDDADDAVIRSAC